MSLDPKIEEAIRKSVKEVDQDEALSREIVAWFAAVSSGNENLADKDSTDRRLERLFGDTILPPDDCVETDKGLEEAVRKVLEEVGPGATEGVRTDDANLPGGGRSTT